MKVFIFAAVVVVILIKVITRIIDSKEQYKAETVRLQSEIRKLVAKNENLTHEIGVLWRRNDRLEDERNSLIKQNKVLTNQNSKIDKELEKALSVNTDLKTDNQNLKELNRELSKHNKQLEKYQDILDAKEEAKKIREAIKAKEEEADAHLESALWYYEETIEAAEQEKERLLNETNENLLHAMDFINIAESLENKLGNYKNESKYFVSPYTLFDDLARDYSYHEAGQQLKYARVHSRKMVEENLAAVCEYVETSRKRMAINFVLDSFDSKVEVILSKAKKDNYGIMAQKIKDAYYYVNELGKPFKNAAITPAYLSTKLNELKWLCRVQLLLQEIKDEEYAKKEQMREEIKAQKEREKVILKTQKEITKLQETRENLKQAIQEAKGEEQERLISNLRETEEKLREQTDLNVRAISMAEMVTEGNIYIISNIGSFGENVFKIGMTRKLIPEERVHELSNASVPFPFDIHAIIHSSNAPELEKKLHRTFNLKRVNMVNFRKEFFKITSTEIKEELEKQNIEVEWTELAKAEQYRESLRRKEELESGIITDEALNRMMKRYSSIEAELEMDYAVEDERE